MKRGVHVNGFAFVLGSPFLRSVFPIYRSCVEFRWGRQRLHIGLCGHAVHFSCWDAYFQSLIGRSNASQVCCVVLSYSGTAVQQNSWACVSRALVFIYPDVNEHHEGRPLERASVYFSDVDADVDLLAHPTPSRPPPPVHARLRHRMHSHKTQTFDGRMSVDVHRSEFFCPLCKSLSNTLIAHVPPAAQASTLSSGGGGSDAEAERRAVRRLGTADGLARWVLLEEDGGEGVAAGGGGDGGDAMELDCEGGGDGGGDAAGVDGKGKGKGGSGAARTLKVRSDRWAGLFLVWLRIVGRRLLLLLWLHVAAAVAAAAAGLFLMQ